MNRTSEKFNTNIRSKELLNQIWPLMFLYGGKLLESHLMEETYSIWPEWQKVYVKIKMLTPGDCLPLTWGYVHV